MTYTTKEFLTNKCLYTTVPEIKDQDLIKYVNTGTSQTDTSFTVSPEYKIKGNIKIVTNDTEKPLTDTWHYTTGTRIKGQNVIKYMTNGTSQTDVALFKNPADEIEDAIEYMISGAYQTDVALIRVPVGESEKLDDQLKHVIPFEVNIFSKIELKNKNK